MNVWFCQKHVDWMKDVINRTYDLVLEHPEFSNKTDIDPVWGIVFQSLQDDGAAIKRACIAITDDVAKVFNHCANAEWIDPDDPEERTLNHHLCSTIMQYFVQQVYVCFPICQNFTLCSRTKT